MASSLDRAVEGLTRSRHRLTAAHQQALRHLARANWWSTPIEEEVTRRDLARRAVLRLRRTESPATLRMLLRRAEGYSWPEIATEVGLTPAAAQTQLRRALFRVRYWLYRRSDGQHNCADTGG